ncbi:histidine kinase [Streptomyces sp. NPDC093970]|uniref:sensor histidine kinase n=1 Tax=Streptomyces sp. NPDC093970 TaxID=3155076 RepID=UPI003430E216
MSREPGRRLPWFGPGALVTSVLGSALVAAAALVVASAVAVAVWAGSGWRPGVASGLAVVTVAALWWVLRAPAAVLGLTTVTGLALWALFPPVGLTGALLAAQVALCVLAATRPGRSSRWAAAVMCAPAPLALLAGDRLVLPLYLLAVALAWTAGELYRTRRARAAAETRRAVAEERARIARDVHDVVAHTVSVMVIQASAAEDGFAARPEQARQALRDIEAVGRSALAELRLLLRAFDDDREADGPGHGPGYGPVGLARLDELADVTRAAGLSVVVRRDGPGGVPGDVPGGDGTSAAADLTAYRIIQEALTNVLRHAPDADEVRVSVHLGAAAMDIEVIDNGRARQPRPPSPVPAGSGRGLTGMRERAAALGGSLRAGPLDGGGWGVRATLPTGGATRRAERAAGLPGEGAS